MIKYIPVFKIYSQEVVISGVYKNNNELGLYCKTTRATS